MSFIYQWVYNLILIYEYHQMQTKCVLVIRDPVHCHSLYSFVRLDQSKFTFTRRKTEELLHLVKGNRWCYIY